MGFVAVRADLPGLKRIALGKTAMWTSMLVVLIGGAFGCLLRWAFGSGLNLLFPAIPPGTLAANWIGGYLVGLSIAYFAANPELPAHWRLLVITGFLGGLTTFSSFSGEVVLLLREQRLGMAIAAIGLHLGGSLVLTTVGMASSRLFRT